MNYFNDKVVYQIYPKSFKDSDGDGIGDLKGIIQKLDYIKNLGVDYIWLTPVFPSPQNDNGYDISNYYEIDPMFGTMADMEELIAQSKKRGMEIMLDMVFNHTSTSHEWFQKALAGEKKYQDYYIFKEGKEVPTNWESKFGGSAWEYVPSLQKWYLHLYDVTQADLNWDNPCVREELKKVVCFWKQKGVQGFRFDVINVISKPEVFENDMQGDGRRFYTDGPHVHEYLKELVRDTGIENMITVGEMSSTTLQDCIRYSNPEEKELSMCFNFHHLKIDYKDGNKWEIMKPDRMALKNLLEQWQVTMQQHNGWNALFWCNHDQPRIVSRLGEEGKYWDKSAKMLATCIHMMRGTPYIYQGEELGMTNAHYHKIQQYQDVESLNYYNILLEKGKTEQQALDILSVRSRDNSRTPMQWNDEKNAGFTEGKAWIEIANNYQSINAQSQVADENSIYSFYKKLIALRKNKDVISKGDIVFFEKENADVLAYKRIYQEKEIVVLNNMVSTKVVVSTNLVWKNYNKILGNYEISDISDDKLVLKPFETIILEKK